jgi:hypothetical protein
VTALPGSVTLVRVHYKIILSSERAFHTKRNQKYLKLISMEEKKWSHIPDGGLITGQTCRLTVGRKMAFTWTSVLLSGVRDSFH